MQISTQGKNDSKHKNAYCMKNAKQPYNNIICKLKGNLGAMIKIVVIW